MKHGSTRTCGELFQGSKLLLSLRKCLTFPCRCAEEFSPLFNAPLGCLLTTLILSRCPLQIRAIDNNRLRPRVFLLPLLPSDGRSRLSVVHVICRHVGSQGDHLGTSLSFSVRLLRLRHPGLQPLVRPFGCSGFLRLLMKGYCSPVEVRPSIALRLEL